MVRRIVLSFAEQWQHSVAMWVAARDRWDTGTWLARSWGQRTRPVAVGRLGTSETQGAAGACPSS